MTTTIEQISQAAQKLTPDEIRVRLEDIDREARILRAILRAALRGAPNAKKAGALAE